MKKNTTIDGVEILRFISAFAILVWHYQHFNYPITNEIKINQPLYRYLKFFYVYGYMGVYFFWCISGFIFFWKYGDKIKELSFKIFFIARFSRLYPLHFLTLLLVLIFQNIFFSLNNDFFIVKNNDFYHFFLQIFMASNWGFENGTSFNGVIWSISIEILIYGVFFLILNFFKKNLIINFFIVAICILFKFIYEHNTSLIIDCALFFFIGGSVIFLIEKFERKKLNIIKFILSFLVLGIFLVYDILSLKMNNHLYIAQMIIYPLLILLFGDLYISKKKISNILKILGNLTYSSYLLHFPLQILIMIIYSHFSSPIPFYNNLFFVLYIVLVLSFSYFTFKYFENPMKIIIRNKFST